MPNPQKWPTCGNELKQYIFQFCDLLEHSLGELIIGIYLHGSLAMGSYYSPKSDMDIIAVISQKLDAKHADDLLFEIALFSECRPTVGDIEFSVITLLSAHTVPNPMPYEIHYSSYWHDQIIKRAVHYNEDQFDSDLFAHLTCLKKRGVCLIGMPIADVFGDVNWNDFMFAVLDDLKWILEDENILESPYYCILNICRVFQLLVTKTQNSFSKDEGAMWGLTYFPPNFTSLIKAALMVYHSDAIIEEVNRKRGGVEWNHANLLTFRDYARSLLKSLS